MGNIVNLKEEFLRIFHSIQSSSGSHQKEVLKLKTLYSVVNPDLFFITFKRFTDGFLAQDSKVKNPYIERTMEFIALLCLSFKQDFEAALTKGSSVTESAEHPFLEKFILFVLDRSRLVNFDVRVRSCQLINRILDQLIGTDLSTDFCDKLEDSMLERLSDPKLDVRLEGILALHRFQEKHNPLDRIIDMLKILMQEDRFAKVRRLCVEKIALRLDVIPIIILKIRDVDPSVRLAAFMRLCKLVGCLKIEQRRLVLKCAAFETSEKIKQFIEKDLLPKWLLFYKHSFHSFMKAVRLDADESDVTETNRTCEFILQKLLKTKPLDELILALNIDHNKKLIPLEDLNWETCNYWRILVQYIRENEYLDEEINDVLPELVHFCNYINRFCNNLPSVETTTDFLENQFIIKQLFTISKGYDTSDPSGRQALKKTVHDVLAHVVLTLDAVEVIVSNLESIFPNTELRARYINELISEIVSPEDLEENMRKQAEFDKKMMCIKNKIAEILSKQEEAIQSKQYLIAGELENQMKQLTKEEDQLINENANEKIETPNKKQDVATLVKILDIATGFSLSQQVINMTSSLETLKKDTVYDLLIHENETVQSKAFHCYALFCIIDKKTACDGIHIFSAPIFAYQSGQECDIQILLVCIGAIVDCLRIFGTQLMATPEEKTDLSESQREEHQRHFYGGTSLTSIIQGLVDLMDDEQIQVQETAGRGLCSLVLSDTIQSSSLLSRLVLKWCNPYDPSQKLKQLIGVTIQQLPRLPTFQKQWENAIFLTVRAIVYTPPNSSYDDVNVEDIAKFMISLYQVNVVNNETITAFATRICYEIMKKPRAKQVTILSKMLNMLKVSSKNCEDLVSICSEIRDSTNNSAVTTNIIKFMAKLHPVTPGGSRLSSMDIGNDSDSDNDEDSGLDNRRNGQREQVPMIVEEDEDEV